VGRDRKRQRDLVVRVPEAEACEVEEWLRAIEKRRKETSGFEFGDRWFLRPAIEDGDWDPLADYYRRGFPETPAIRAFVAEVLSGERKRAKTRPIKARTRTAYLQVAAFVFDLRQKGARDPIKQATEAGFGMDRRTVQRAVAAWPEMNEEMAALVLVAIGRRDAVPIVNEGSATIGETLVTWKFWEGNPPEWPPKG
jgi:hypothetical protein